jgi:hypothetical protein
MYYVDGGKKRGQVVSKSIDPGLTMIANRHRSSNQSGSDGGNDAENWAF